MCISCSSPNLARGLLVQLLEPRNEVAAHGAADAAVVHLDDVLLRHRALRVQQGVVDAHLGRPSENHSSDFGPKGRRNGSFRPPRTRSR